MSKSCPLPAVRRWTTKKRHHSFTLANTCAKFSIPKKKRSKQKGRRVNFYGQATASESTPSEVPGPSHAPAGQARLSPTGAKRKRPSENLDCPQKETRATSPARKRSRETEEDTPKDHEAPVKLGRKILPTLRTLTKSIRKESSRFSPSSSPDHSPQQSSSAVLEPTNEDQEMSADPEHEESEGQEDEELDHKFYKKYEVLSQCGEGGFAQVFSGQRLEDNLPVAIKIISKQHARFVEEIVDGVEVRMPLEVYLLHEVGAGCNSTSCSVTPLLLDWYEIEEDIVLVLERPEPCSNLLEYILYQHKKNMDHETVKNIFRQLVEEAIEMDAKGVFHRDIKPENILIEGDMVATRARFIDFGCGTAFSPGETFQQQTGTARYFAPECYRDESYSPGPTTVWQLGLVLYMMVDNKLPLRSEESIKSSRQVPIPTKFQPELRNLLKGCLQKNPQKRITLQDMINHPWLKLPSS